MTPAPARSQTRVHLLRHGETRHNAERRIQGDALDDPLNGVGRAQAEALARHYAAAKANGESFKAVYASPLQRARLTADRIAHALQLDPPTIVPGLREISWGQHHGKLNIGPTLADMTRVLSSWEEGDLSARVLGGETPSEAWERAINDLAPILDAHEGETIIVVAHGRINKIIMSGLLHGHLRHMEHYPQANAGITLINGPFPWRIIASNRTDHLAGLRALDERAG